MKMRSKYFSLGFAENIGKFVIFREDIEKVRSLYKFCGVGLNVWKAKIELKIARAWKFWCMQKCYSTNDSNVRSLRSRYGGLRCRYSVTNFIQLVSPQLVDWFLPTKLHCKAPNKGDLPIYGMYKSLLISHELLDRFTQSNLH